MVTKFCKKCKEDLPVSRFNKGRQKDGLQSYCISCNTQLNKESQLRNKKQWWNKDGYLTEKDHFNAALENYAEVFNMPQLLKHKKQ